jgi:hypothetical protein
MSRFLIHRPIVTIRQFMRAAVVACALALCVQPLAQVRVSQMGSDPLLSAELFPQDMQAWPLYGFSYSPSYAKLPYWGRIDDPLARPNGNYTSTGLTEGNFSHSAEIYSVMNGVSYTHRFSPAVTALARFDGDMDAQLTRADGVLHAHDSTGAVDGTPVPFGYSMNHILGTGKFTGASAFAVKGMPVGVRLQFGVQSTAALNHSMTFTKDGIAYNSDRATWGWTTTPCAHVFGLHGPEGDTWLQNDYAVGPLYSVDLQAGANLPFGKTGLRISTLSGHQDYYSWVADSGAFGLDTTINKNFIGHYEKSQWSRTTGGFAAQLYTNYTIRQHDRFALNLFGRLRYNGLSQGEALSSNLNVSNNSAQALHGFAVDVAPNLTLPFGSLFNYIDVAIPLLYGYTRHGNTYDRWVGGGQISTYWDTQTSPEDENSWEPYSYADQHDIAAGIDFCTMFPLVNKPGMQLGLGVQLLINASATYTIKNYGTNTDNGSNVTFTVQQKRYDYEGRKQFSTGVKLQYQGGRSFGWIEINEPLLQAVRPITQVTDASGNNILYEHEKEPLWISMQGLRVGIVYTYQMTIPWLNRFNAE